MAGLMSVEQFLKHAIYLKYTRKRFCTNKKGPAFLQVLDFTTYWMASPRGFDRWPVFIEYQRNTAKVAAKFGCADRGPLSRLPGL